MNKSSTKSWFVEHLFSMGIITCIDLGANLIVEMVCSKEFQANPQESVVGPLILRCQ